MSTYAVWPQYGIYPLKDIKKMFFNVQTAHVLSYDLDDNYGHSQY